MTRFAALALMLLCLASLPACGDDSGGGTTTTSTTLSEKAAYIADADTICGQLATEIKALPAPTTIEETGLYLQERVVLATRAREALAALHPPADANDVQQALLDSLDRSTAKVQEALHAAADGDPATLGTLLDEARSLGQASNAEADAYGFDECGSG